MLHSGDLNFSFSGLKTAVLTKVRATSNVCEQERADIAFAFVDAVVDVLVAKSLQALRVTGLSTLVVAGGVGANKQLRARLVDVAQTNSVRLFFPPLDLCTDNGAMIALAGLARLHSVSTVPAKAFEVRPRWPLATA
jgi:N6-L-threonylcarbamoyladenine synthase